ncbi:kinase-like domain-containing protein [Hypoxylon sp. NC0597]|nr:kinase-like domain-containing protein [Hypoxylon sp. NC0597]
MKMSHNSGSAKASSTRSRSTVVKPYQPSAKGEDHESEAKAISEAEEPPASRYLWPDNQFSADYEENGMYLEDFETYATGGNHPVHIGDVLDGRYEVAHKLGSGGYGLVWLCRDTALHSWKAVKILMASHSSESCPEIKMKKILGDSKFLAIPETHFWIHGPNGRHLALVMPVFGPPVSWLRTLISDPVIIRKVCYKIAKALNYLHSRKVCHADFRLANILLRMDNMDPVTKEQLWELLGTPSSMEYYEPVRTVDGSRSSNAPRYAVRSADLRRLRDWIVVDDIVVADFGLAFDMDLPKSSGIPMGSAAPELLFDRTPDLSSDIWSFAYGIIELYSGHRFIANTDAAIRVMEYRLGPLPEVYRQAYAKKHPRLSPPPDEGEIQQYNSEDEDADDYEDYEEPYFEWPVIPVDPKMEDHYLVWNPRELQEKRKMHIGTNDCADLLNATLKEKCTLGGFAILKRTYSMPHREALQLSGLLRRMLRYLPEERLTAAAVLEHPWMAEYADKSEPGTTLSPALNNKFQELMDLLRDITARTPRNNDDVERILACVKDDLMALK